MEEGGRLPARSTRGRRMVALVGEEKDADEAFWHQKFFAEKEDDGEFKEAEVEEDFVDSDFDLPEDEAEEVVDEASLEEKKKKKSVYVDPKAHGGAKSAERRSVTRKEKMREAAERRKRRREEQTATTKEHLERVVEDDGPRGSRTMRSSTRQQTVEVAHLQLQREKEREVRQAKYRAAKGSSLGVKKLTQEEMLTEAAQTELWNQASLEYLLQLEEDKKALRSTKVTATGPLAKFASTEEGTTVTFTGSPKDMPAFVVRRQIAAPYPPQHTCAVTGQPARYLDPRTGTPYSTAEAFKIIRERVYQLEDAKCDRKIEELNALLERKKRRKDELAHASL